MMLGLSLESIDSLGCILSLLVIFSKANPGCHTMCFSLFDPTTSQKGQKLIEKVHTKCLNINIEQNPNQSLRNSSSSRKLFSLGGFIYFNFIVLNYSALWIMFHDVPERAGCVSIKLPGVLRFSSFL
jgi:hypothetical protein